MDRRDAKVLLAKDDGTPYYNASEVVNNTYYRIEECLYTYEDAVEYVQEMLSCTKTEARAYVNSMSYDYQT